MTIEEMCRPVALALALGAVTGACKADRTVVADTVGGAECPAGVPIRISASADAVLAGPALRVFGTTVAADGVTVRSIWVAGVEVPRTGFNFRGWSVDVPADRVASLARAGQAQIPVVAFTSAGCASLTPPLAVRVETDAGAAPEDAATSDDAAAGDDAVAGDDAAAANDAAAGGDGGSTQDAD